MAKKLPKEVFVRWNDDGGKTDPPYLLAHESADGAGEGEYEWITVGVYRLVDTIKVRETTEIQKKKGA